MNRLHPWLWVLGLILGSCTPVPSTVATHTENLTVYGVGGSLAGAPGVISTDRADGGAAEAYEVDSDSSGRMRFVVPNTVRGGLSLSIVADGYERWTVGTVFCASDCEHEAAHLTRVRGDLPPLIASGQFLRQGPSRWTLIGASDFNLFARFLHGEDIEPVLVQRCDAAGFNTLRVFTAFNICPTGNCPPNNQPIGRLVPREVTGYYDRVPVFLDSLSRHHCYAELVAFTGPYAGVLDSDQDKILHWRNLCAGARRRPNVLLELVNESDNAPNRGLPYDRLPDCDGVMTSHGSSVADSLPVMPFWRYATYHPGGENPGEWPRRTAYGALDDVGRGFNVPVTSNENPRFPDFPGATCQQAYDAARGAALLTAGATFHSVHGKSSEPWTGTELECARAWSAGAHSMDLTCQEQPFARRMDLEASGILRVYQRGNRPECLAVIRR